MANYITEGKMRKPEETVIKTTQMKHRKKTTCQTTGMSCGPVAQVTRVPQEGMKIEKHLKK